MTLPTTDTRVGYPAGELASTGRVLHVEPLADGGAVVLLDRTAFHPVDTAWPDQPADRGRMRWPGGEAEIVDGITGGVHEGALALGPDLPVRGGTPGWVFVVGHVLAVAGPAVGDTVEVEVDAAHRLALSAGHTGCHLASLALDAALADAWTKPVRADALGHPGFDGAAITSSRIEPWGSVDVYRVGRSLRKAASRSPPSTTRMRSPPVRTRCSPRGSRPGRPSASSATTRPSRSAAAGCASCRTPRRASRAGAPT